MKGAWMLFGKFELRPMWAWLKIKFTPKRYHSKTDRQLRAILTLMTVKTLTSNVFI